MNGAFYIGGIGLGAQQRALDTIANNITNINTPSFKRSQVRFSEVLAGRSDAAARVIATAGVRADAMFMLDEQGRVESTGRPLDLAIEGRGFIELMGPGGEVMLWRGGTLKVDGDGMLASAQGLPLRAGITVPVDATSVTIGTDGVVRAVVSDGGEPVEIGQIMLVHVHDPAAVQRLDGGLYRVLDGVRLVDARPGEDGAGLLIQGAIERSTVELTAEMVQLMLVQRAYAANAQIVQASDQLMAIANGLRR